MPIPFLGAGLLAGARALGGKLAGAGIIRGTAGKVLRGGAPTATAAGIGTSLVKTIPRLPTTIPRIGGAVGGAIAARGGARALSKKAAGLIAAGVAFEAGGKLFNSITGKEIKQSRRINPGNTRALKRSVRRINSAAKMYGKLLSAQKGKRCSGFTIKPKGSKKGCR